MISCQDDTTSIFHLSHIREREYQREHHIAQSLQNVMLRTVPQEALPGISFEAFYEAALDEAMVGGDSFDAFVLDKHKVVLAVIDASGKGLDAAERVAEIRFALRAFLREHDDPGRALSCLNDFVCEAQRLGWQDDTAFATLTMLIMDGSSGEMSCLCAGGEPPLVLRANGEIEVVQICGSALGLRPRQGYTEVTFRLDAGDSVMMTTDGITEARTLTRSSTPGSRTGPFLGLAGVAHLAVQAQRPEASLHQMGHAIFEGARQYAGGSFHDDACLLIGRRKA